jgi:hypothetical protein
LRERLYWQQSLEIYQKIRDENQEVEVKKIALFTNIGKLSSI